MANFTVFDVVADYGADPTGTLDSTTAIQNAINAAGSNGIVWFPAGTYLISSTLTVGNGAGVNTTTTAAYTLPTGTIAVASTAGFASSGQIGVFTTSFQTITYTGTTSTTFTGCSGGSGVVTNGAAVTQGTMSSTSGIRLLGAGMPGSDFGAFQQVGVTLKWTGASGGGPVLSIKGPIQGCGLENLCIDGNSLANVGLLVTSGENGNNRNLWIKGCRTIAIETTAVYPFPAALGPNTMHNWWENIAIDVFAGNGAMGIFATGNPYANTC